MTTNPRLERDLPGILGDLSAAPTPEYLDDVFVRTGRMRQRPGWTFPERWLPMADITRPRAFASAPPLRSIAVALVAIALLVAMALFYVGSQQRRVPAPFGPAANGLITYEGGGNIYVGDPATRSSRVLVGGADDDHNPGFSPDGTLVAFLRSVSTTDNEIYTVRSDGTDLRKVTAASIPADTWVNWAPDSKHFAAIVPASGDATIDDIGVLDLDGQMRRLPTGMDITSLAFRPPLAQEILFRGLGGGHPGLYVMNADGTNVRPLLTVQTPPDYDQDLNSATYSADGSRIFYQRWTPDAIQLWVMEADGSNPHRFVSDVDRAWEGEISVSPDGRWIAFWRVSGNSQHVYVVHADGTGPVIPVGPRLDGSVAFGWSPDSSKLLMVPQDDVDMARQYFADPAPAQFTTSEWETRTAPDWQRLAP